MHQHLEFPRLGMTVTIAPTDPATMADLEAARRTHGEMLALLDELTRAAADQQTLHTVLRSIQGMARSVHVRLERIGGPRGT